MWMSKKGERAFKKRMKVSKNKRVCSKIKGWKGKRKVLDVTLVLRREVLSSWCSTLFDGWFMPYSCTAGTRGSTVMFEQRPLYIGGAITGGKEKLHFLPFFGNFLIFKSIEYWKVTVLPYMERARHQ